VAEHFLGLFKLWEKYYYTYLRGRHDVNGICDRLSVIPQPDYRSGEIAFIVECT
jgi:hypothetical protein